MKGTEERPFISPDGTAGIQERIDALSIRGGKLPLECGRYDIDNTIKVNIPCIHIDGDSWSYSSDPNGVFESKYGTKLRLKADIPAMSIGIDHTVEGLLFQNFGVQGNIVGMDTRKFLLGDEPEGGTGLLYAHTRMDQAEFSKLTFCGLGCALKFTEDSEIDACNFERINVDGCAVGVWFAPRAAYYNQFRKFVFADNPYYGFYADGTDKNMHNLELLDNIFVRTGGAFSDDGKHIPAAIYFNNIDNSLIRDNLIDDPGTFWYFNEDADKNDMRQPSHRDTPAIVVRGNNNRIMNNVITNCTTTAIHIIGDGNVLINNIVDNDVIIEGENNQVVGLVFTNSHAKLIVKDKSTNAVNGVKEEDYPYLNPLSDETKCFVLGKIRNSDPNPYHSIMAVLENRYKSGKMSLILETEFEYYINRKNISENDIPFYRELFDLCWKRFLKKRSL